MVPETPRTSRLRYRIGFTNQQALSESATRALTPPRTRGEASTGRRGWRAGTSRYLLSRRQTDGKKVQGFERKHLYGALGILMVAGINRKRRIRDHWDTGPLDDCPMVRKCMPRDVFLGFYPRLFRMPAATRHVNKDHPEYESKRHTRCVRGRCEVVGEGDAAVLAKSIARHWCLRVFRATCFCTCSVALHPSILLVLHCTKACS